MDKMKRIWMVLFFMIALGCITFGNYAQAAPVVAGSPYTDGRDLFLDGTSWKAVFLFSDAGDTNELYEAVTPTGLIFRNHDPGATPIGTTKSFSGSGGQLLTFQLKDLTVPNTWSTGVGSTNVAYYNYIGIADLETKFGVNLDPVAEAALTALHSQYGKALILGFEDRPLAESDRDFNDLIFAFAPMKTSVPEPGTLVLIGLGLVGTAIARKRMKK